MAKNDDRFNRGAMASLLIMAGLALALALFGFGGE